MRGKPVLALLLSLALLLTYLPQNVSASLPSNVMFLSHFDGTTKNERDGDLGTADVSYKNAKFDKGVYVDEGDVLRYKSSGNFNYQKGTIEFWVKPSWSTGTGDPEYYNLLVANIGSGSEAGDANSIQIFKKSPDEIHAFMVGDPGGLTEVSAPITWSAGSLHHVAVTWDTTTSPKFFRLYLDGNLSGSADPDDTGGIPRQQKPFIFVGTYADLSDPARATIDELIVFNYAKASSEISADYNKNEPFFPSAEPPPPLPPQPPKEEPVLPGDREKPKISIDELLTVYKKGKITVTGVATDNVAVSKVEYSLDRVGYIGAKITKSEQGGKKVFFEFTTHELEDGDYRIKVRAIDANNNEGSSLTPFFVVDTLLPIVGGNLVSIGPQILQPDETGVIQSLIGVNQKITVASVGGPNKINISATKIDNKKVTATFDLTKSIESGLWSGILNFTESGVYELKVASVDGAGNKLVRRLNTVSVSEPSKLLNEGNSEPVPNAKVTLYYLERETDTWTVWDGTSYGQENPQVAGAGGEFNLFIPPGKYYLKAQARGFSTLISNIFGIDKPTPMVADLSMRESFKLRLGFISITLPLPLFSTEKITLESGITKLPEKSTVESLQGKSLPSFSLPSTSGEEVNSIELLGKPTLLSFITTWSPAAREQFPTLADFQKNSNLNVRPVSTLESLAKVEVYLKIAGYEMNILIDKDGTTVEKFNLQSLPTHYFINRKGVIKKVVVGVLSKQELLDNLVGL